jgi:signal transduction histidine kinase
VVAHRADLGIEREWIIDVATRLNSYVWFAIILMFIARYLRGQAQRLEDLTQQRLCAEAEHARSAERLSQFRRLHDTVLTTLTAIARGGLDHNAEQVRRRCAADAAYVRLLITSDPKGSDLADRLAEVAAGATDLGLRIRYSAEPVTASLPADVVVAMSDACREALNNVALHSGTADAWLTVIDEEGVVTVRIVDRGSGFDPDRTCGGFGLNQSVLARMHEVGGRAEIFSLPGDGTCVDLVWPGVGGEAASTPHVGTAQSA